MPPFPSHTLPKGTLALPYVKKGTAKPTILVALELPDQDTILNEPDLAERARLIASALGDRRNTPHVLDGLLDRDR